MSIPIEHFNRSASLVTEAVRDLLSLGSSVDKHMIAAGRPADGERIRAVVAAVADSPMRVVVVGEHKSGKSSLINALVGRPVLDADPLRSSDFTTEVRYGESFDTFVDVEREGVWSTFALDRDEGMPTGPDVRGIRITVPAALLSSGLALLDTPSMSGGIGSATAASVLAELMQSQAWILTTDASQELTGPELELIKIGSSLCPIVLVVATKCDLAGSWRQIVATNLGHLERLDLPVDPVIIPTASSLRNTAIRLGDAKIDLESGIPLLTWYLTRATTVTARAAAANAALGTVIADLEGLERAASDEIDVIVDSGERARILKESELARDTCDRLARTSRAVVDRSTRAFQREVQRDLQDRVDALRRETMDDLARLGGEREWPKIEQRTQTEVNRLLADHLRTVRDLVDAAIESVARELEVERGDVDVAGDLVISKSGGDQVAAHLDSPKLSTSGFSRLQPALMSARVGVTSASGVGLGLSSGLLAGATAVAGVVMVPIAAIGAGWWVRQRSKEHERMPWRRQAEIELNRFLTDCHQVIGRCSEDMCDDVIGQLPNLLEQRLRALTERLAADFERLTALADDRGNMHRSQIESIEARRDGIRLLASQARRLRHQIESPVISLPLHIASRSTPPS